jgi:hypothetical protein
MLRVLLALTATTLVVAVGAPAAGAATVLTCPGTETSTFSPPLTDTPTPTSITISHHYGPCVNAADPLELRTGTASVTIPSGAATCTSLLFTTHMSRVIHWSTGTTSTFELTANASFLPGGVIQIVEDGSITAGEFAGDTVLSTVTVAAPNFLVDCAGAGVSQFTGVATMTIADV